MRQINLSTQGQSRSIGFDQLSTDAAMAILAMKPVEDYVQNASAVSVISGASHVSVSLDGPFLFADSATHSDADGRVVNKGKFAFRSTESVNEKAKVHLLNAADNTPLQDSQGKELVAFLRVDESNSNATRLDFHVDNGDGTYTSAVVPAGVTALLFQWLQRFSFDEVRPEVASTKKFFHGVVDVAVDNDLNQLLKDVYGAGGSFNGTGQGSFSAGESVAERLDGLDSDLALETTARQSADAALQSTLDSEVAALEASIAALGAGASGDVQQLQAELDQEVLDRIADVNAEEDRALAAEAALQSDIDAEEARALAAEAALQTALDAEEARAQAEEADIRVDFAAADASLQNTLQTAISNEQSRAQAEEADIRVDFAAADAVLQTAVDAEETRALAAEVALSGEITTLGLDLASEVARALASEAALQTALDAEETRAMAEEADIRVDFAAADAATLSSAEDYTDQKIADLVNGAPALLDTLKEIADQLAEDESLVNALTNTVAANLVEAKAYTDTEVTALETALQAEIDAEETRALAAESALSGAIQALSGNSGSSLSALQAELDAEEARALAAEAALDAAKFDKAGGAIDSDGSIELSNDDASASISGSEVSIVADHTPYDDFALVSSTQNLEGFKWVYQEDGGVSKDFSLGQNGLYLTGNLLNINSGTISLDYNGVNINVNQPQANSKSQFSVDYSGITMQFGTSAQFQQMLQFKNNGLELLNPNTGIAIMPVFDTNLVTKKYVDQSNTSLSGELHDAVDAEETRALAAEATLQTAIDDEEARAVLAEGALQTDINAEETRALAAEAALDGRLDTLEAGNTVVGSVAHAVKAEETRALTAEAVLQSNINTEASARVAADGVLQSNINTEASARVSGDSNLQSQVDSLLSALNSYKALVGKPVDMETVTFQNDGSYILQAAPSGIVSGSKPMLAINGVLQEIGGVSPDFSVVADGSGIVRKVQLILGNKTVSSLLGPNGTAVIWYRAVI